MKYENIIKETKEMYPNLKDDEILKLIDEALEQKHIQEIILGYICYKMKFEKEK